MTGHRDLCNCPECVDYDDRALWQGSLLCVAAAMVAAALLGWLLGRFTS